MYINWLPIFGPKIGWKRAEAEIPMLAKELGLSFTQAKHMDDIGIMKGTIDGIKVNVDVDKQKLHVVLPGNPQKYKNAELLTDRKSTVRSPLHFKSNDGKFNRVFKTKMAPEALQKNIDSRPSFMTNIHALFKCRWESISVYDENFTIRYKGPGFARNYGTYAGHETHVALRGYTYIPAAYLRIVVPLMVECAKALN